MKNTLIVLCLAAVMVIPRLTGGQTNELKAGDQPPPLALQRLLQAPTGAKADWSSLKGKAVVLEFWATWCGPCVAAIPHLNELADQFKSQPVQFIAITDEDENVIAPFLKKKPMHAWVGLNTDRSMLKAYGVTAIPHTVVVDRKGKIVLITYPTGLTEQILKDVLAGKELPLALQKQGQRMGFRPGDVPNSAEGSQTNLFQVLIRPTPSDAQKGSRMGSGNGSLTISGGSVFEALCACYGFSSVRILTNSPLPEGKFDFVVKTPSKNSDTAREWLRNAVEAAFGLQAKRQTKAMDVFVLSVASPEAKGLAPAASTKGSSSSVGPGRIRAANVSIAALVKPLESKLGKPVVDETRLPNHYDFELKWTEGDDAAQTAEALIRAAREQLGLALTPASRPIEVVVVEMAPKQ